MPENPDPRRADWSAIYYHRADAAGVGFDRTARGSGAVNQYRSPLREQFADPRTCPENLLLWFHRVPWDHRMKSGRGLWDELVLHYSRGAEEARRLLSTWEGLRGKVDDERHAAVLAKLRRQATEAAAWRDKCLRYFQTFSKRPLPATIGPAPPTAQ
jgi:alpha-glucuronidase